MPQPPDKEMAEPWQAPPQQALGKTDKKINSPISKKLQADVPEIIAAVAKSHSAQLRISLTSWRGQHKCEIRECTASVPGNYWPTAAGVSLAADKLDELIAALSKARARAVSLGLLSNGGCHEHLRS
jgi:hypothetical protein